MRRFLLALLLLPALARADGLLHAGPMHAWTELRAAAIWVQSERAADVQLRYFPASDQSKARLTPVVRTAEAEAFTATFVLSGLEPGTTYRYELYIDGVLIERPYPLELATQPLWQWRSPAPDFTAVFGSGAYVNEPPYDRPGKPYGADFQVFGAIAAVKPDLMLWLGDNVYYREADFFSGAGLAARYWHDRALPALQPLLAATSHYAVWDDHDFGPNDSDGTYQLKGRSLELLARYFPAVQYGLPEVPGAFQKVSWSDVDFFLLDDRYYRKPNHWPERAGKTMLGRAQLDWLKEALVYSRASFKVVALGNQVLNPIGAYERLTRYPADYDELVEWITSRRIDGVFFISGDRHHTELIRVQPPGGYPLYDFTDSPWTSGLHVIPPGDPELDNPHRVPGTLVAVHGYGVLRFAGPRGARTVTFAAYDAAGTLLWSHAVARTELSFPEVPPKPGEWRRVEPQP